MFESRNILIGRTQRASVVSDAADTSITVNHGGGGMPPRPDFTPATRPAPQAPATASTYSTTSTAAPATRTVTTTHRQVNWGGVVKGAAIVTGVVVAAVAAAYIVPALLTSAGIIGPSGIATGLVEAATPAVNSVIGTVSPIVSSVATTVGNGLFYAAHFLEATVSNIFTAVGGTAAVESVTATASAATTSAVNSVTAAVAGGAAFAAAAPMAMKHLLVTPGPDLVTQTHAVPVATGLEDGGATLAAQKKSVIAANAAPDHDPRGDHMSGFDAPDIDLTDEAAANMKTATKVAHHAAHEAEGHGGHAESASDSHRDAIRKSASRSEAWADRVGRREQAAVTPRSAQFAEQLADDRAQLDAALKTHSV